MFLLLPDSIQRLETSDMAVVTHTSAVFQKDPKGL